MVNSWQHKDVAGKIGNGLSIEQSQRIQSAIRVGQASVSSFQRWYMKRFQHLTYVRRVVMRLLGKLVPEDVVWIIMEYVLPLNTDLPIAITINYPFLSRRIKESFVKWSSPDGKDEYAYALIPRKMKLAETANGVLYPIRNYYFFAQHHSVPLGNCLQWVIEVDIASVYQTGHYGSINVRDCVVFLNGLVRNELAYTICQYPEFLGRNFIERHYGGVIPQIPTIVDANEIAHSFWRLVWGFDPTCKPCLLTSRLRWIQDELGAFFP